MKIFGYEIKKFVSKAEQIADCKKAYKEYQRKTLYEWDTTKGEYFAATRDIPWMVCGRSGRWILIGSDSTYAKGCIKKMNFKSVDDVCDTQPHFCYRFIRPEQLWKKFHSFPYSRSKYYR